MFYCKVEMNFGLKYVQIRMEREMIKHLTLWNGGISNKYCKQQVRHTRKQHHKPSSTVDLNAATPGLFPSWKNA